MLKHVGVLSLLFYVGVGFGQINVHINSGNPRIPFPQFLDYKAGKTLGRDNAVGVTDIEMERDIREAYQIMMNRANYTGQVYDGVHYIEFNSNCLCENTCTEGDGYALLAAAYMADKTTFDGLWAWIHDQRMNLVARFYDCSIVNDRSGVNYDPRVGQFGLYPYGQYTIANCAQDGHRENSENEKNTATDGDNDIVMAMLVAYYQWGNQSILTSDCGETITYKNELIKLLKGKADTVFFFNNSGHPDPRNDVSGGNGYYSGNIGFDGYLKSGNTWGEVTSWAKDNGYTYDGTTYYPRSNPPNSHHTSYLAPSYFRSFYNFLLDEDSTAYSFLINQYKRAEASSDWLMGQLYGKGYYPHAGRHTVNSDGSNTTFSDDGFAEDSRNPWRTIMNYVWHDNPLSTWDPVTHEVTPNVPNTFEYDNAMRYAEMLRLNDVCNQLGNDPTLNLQFSGPATLVDEIGISTGNIPKAVASTINFNLGSGAPSIVAYHHENNNEISHQLIAEWYRQLVLIWDGVALAEESFPDNRYIKSLPGFFHGWFRVLGLMVTTGNHQSPEFMSQETLPANVKVYNEVDKTVAFGPRFKEGRLITPGDELNYTFSYRNFSSTAAQNVQITYDVPEELEVVSVGDGGTNQGNQIVWNVGSTPGYTSTGETGDDWRSFDPTTYNTYGEVKLKLRVKEGYQDVIVCNQPTITADNSDSYTSNEYPNNYTSTMERNCVDLRERDLSIAMTSDKTVLKNGDRVNFTINFSNSSKSGSLNGGRPNVMVTYASGTGLAYTMVNYFRFISDAQEAYINPGNYRFSYFLNDAARSGILSPQNPNGWFMHTTIEGEGPPMTFSSENYTPGEDQFGKWNQRLIMRFPDTLVPTTSHTYSFFAKPRDDGGFEDNVYKYIHKGAGAPFRTSVQIEARGLPGSTCAGSIPLANTYTDDWSFINNADDMEVSNNLEMFWPISPTWYDYNSSYDESLNQPVTDRYVPNMCSPAVTNVFDRVMIEEFDGYVWRKVLGNGPIQGIELSNVCVYDTLPEGIDFVAFKDDEALGYKATYDPATRVISWCAPSMLPGSVGSLAYEAVAVSDCESNKLVYNQAWIQSSSSSPIDSAVELIITCRDIPERFVLGSTMYKFSDRDSTDVGETITYDVAFKQSDGTIVAPSLSSTDDWQVACGNNMINFAETNQGNGSPTLATYDFSHGTNGTMWAKVVPRLSTSGFSFVFRYNRDDGGAPVCGPYEGLVLGLSVTECALANITLYQNGTKIDEILNVSYARPADTVNIKVELIDGVMLLWLNNEEAIPHTLENITLMSPGYVGFYSGMSDGSNSNERQQLLQWKTHFDSGFDVVIKDFVPNEITIDQSSIIKVESSKSTGGSYDNPVVYNSGSNEISWELVLGKEPMLYGDSVVFQFKGEVNDCGIGFITNTTSASMLGQPEFFIGDQVETQCGEPPVCPLASLALSPTPVLTIPEGGSGALNAILNPASEKGYKYTWYHETIIHDEGMDLLSSNVSVSGNYRLVITDLLDPTCKVESQVVKVVVGEVTCTSPTTATLIPDPTTGEACSPETVTLTASATGTAPTSGWQYAFYNADGNQLVQAASANDTFAVATTGAYYVVISDPADAATCKLQSTDVEVTITSPVTIDTVNTDPSACQSDDGNIQLTGLAASTAYTLTYNGNSEAITSTALGEYVIEGLSSGTYSDVYVTTNGCESNHIAAVTLSDPNGPSAPILTGASDTCSASTVTLTTPLTTDNTYSWAITSTGATFQSTGNTTSEGIDQNQVNVLTTTEDVTITLKATDAQGCESPEATHSIAIIEVEAGVITGNETPNCQATEAYTVTGGNATSYEWSTTATDATPPTQIGTSYTVDFGVLNGQIEAIATLNGCTTPLTPLDIALQGCALKANIQTSALAVCAGEAITFTNISSGGTDFSWEFGTLQTANTEGPHQITLPEGTHDITLTVTDGALSDDSTITVTVKPQPETPTITGLQTVCSNTTETYQVTNPITTATYTWAAPTGASTDGSTTDQTTITYSSAAQSGDVTVEVNQDGCTATATHPITITEGLGDLGPITGEQVLCVDPTNPVTYSVPAITGATSYTWTLPSGLTGTSTTETIEITATSTLEDTIRVTANSDCGSSTQKLAIIVSDKPDQSTATLTDDQSGAICVGTEITYTLNNVTGATTYQWDVPTGGTLKSQTDHQAVIEWTQTGDYTVGVIPINDNCGAGTAVTLPVTVSDIPSSVGIDGATSVCANSTETYEVNTTGVTQAATSYNWSVTAATFDGGFIGVSQVTINTGTANNYTLTVTPFNDCGTGESTDSVVLIQNNLVPEVSIETPEAVCENTAQTLTATILKAGLNPQIRWFIDEEEQTSAANTATPSFTFTGTQTYRVEVVSNASCKDPANDQAEYELETTTTKEPIAGPFTQADIALCEGASGGYEIAPVTDASSYVWEVTGATVATPADGSQVVINNFTVNTQVKVTPVNSCFPTGGQSTEVDVTITPSTTPDITINASENAICAGDEVTYSIATQQNQGSNPSYQWQINGDEVAGETDITFVTTDLNNGDKISVELTSDKACVTPAAVTSNEVAITVSNQQSDFNVDIDTDLAYCEDEQIIVEAITTETVDNYYWKVNGVDQLNNTDRLTLEAPQTANTIEVSLSAGITGGSCGEKRSEEAKKTLTINTIPVTTINNGITSIELCAGEMLTLSSDSIRANYTWKRNGMTLPNNTNPLNLVASKAIAGNYSLEVNNNDACGNTAATNTVAVTVFGTTGFSFNAEEYIVYKTKPFTATITPNEQGDYAVSYDPFQGIDILSQTGYQVTAVTPEKGNYQLIATLRDVNSTLAGCEYTDSLLVRSLEPFIIPNAFSPNGDQVNDKWEIEALIKYPDAWVQIVNRWGALLYEKDGNYVGNEWDGTYESEPLPVGTYYYMIDLKDPEKVFTKIMTGAVTITR